MTNPKWGNKHTCAECGAAFYDMQRSPITCPKCGVKHQPVVLLKSDGRQPRKNRVRPPPPAAEPAAEAAEEPAEAHEDEPEVPELDETTPEEVELDVEGPDDRDTER
jgi:uncharacterized protein (TIGR02300 family)